MRPMPGDQRFSPSDELVDLVSGALAGHEAAWSALVERLERVVWKSVNMMTFDREDAMTPSRRPGCVWQSGSIRSASPRSCRAGSRPRPATRSARSCASARANRSGRRQDRRRRVGRSTAGHDPGRPTANTRPDLMAADESRREVRRAFAKLDEGCREIITVLVIADPPRAYERRACMLGRPIGSLGPTRKRCLDKMKSSCSKATPDHRRRQR